VPATENHIEVDVPMHAVPVPPVAHDPDHHYKERPNQPHRAPSVPVKEPTAVAELEAELVEWLEEQSRADRMDEEDEEIQLPSNVCSRMRVEPSEEYMTVRGVDEEEEGGMAGNDGEDGNDQPPTGASIKNTLTLR
jgi:hypothetical protein